MGLIDNCKISVQKSNRWLEVKPNVNEHLSMCQVQLMLWWSSDILQGASLQLESSVILTIESHLQGKDKKDKFTSRHLLTSLWRWWIPVLVKAQNNWAMASKWENSFHSSFRLNRLSKHLVRLQNNDLNPKCNSSRTHVRQLHMHAQDTCLRITEIFSQVMEYARFYPCVGKQHERNIHTQKSKSL